MQQGPYTSLATPDLNKDLNNGGWRHHYAPPRDSTGTLHINTLKSRSGSRENRRCRVL